MCLTLVPVTVLADDDVQQINDAAVQAITPGSDVSVLSVVPDTGAYRTYKFYSGETLLSEQIVKNGDTLYEPSVTAPAGKTFTGWNPNVTFGTVSNVDKTEDIRVDAQFADGYHVYFKDNNGRIIATKTVTNGTKVTFEDVNFPVGSDEAITGWYEDAGRTKKVDSVTINGADITLYAKVETGYWLTFESNGGSYVAPAFYANGTTAKSPDEPTKSGYAFDGWYTDGGLTTAAAFSSITATTTLYAKWTEDTNTSYTVIHWLENADDDGYSADTKVDTKYGKTGADTAASARSYTGFTPQTITQETIAGDGSTIVKVYYKRNVYSVRFYSNSGRHSSSKEYTNLCITAKYGAYIGDQWPTYDDSNAWATSDGGNTYQVNIDTMPLGGAKFYGPKTGNGSETAYYYVEALPGETGTPGPGNLNYKLHHSDTSPGTGSRVTDEDKYPITGFTFKMFSANWTLGGYKYNNAAFYYTRNSYDLVFISGGKTVKTESVKYQASIAGYANYKHDTAPEGKDGYIFDGWYDNELGEGTAYVFDGKTMPAQNITLYAKWVAPTYTVTVYDVDDETVLKTFTEVPMNNTIDEADMPVDKVTKDTDDEFLGWVLKSDENSLDGMPFNFSTKITKDYELRAKVGSKAQYSVTYNANATGATGSVTDTEKYAKGAEATVMSNSFKNGDMVFLGWNTRADGKGETYYPNGTIKVTGNMDLYARWGRRSSTATVTYHSNFGTDRTYVTDAEVNNARITVADYTTLGLPARTGYTFAGWTTAADGTGTKFNANASARVDNGSNDLYAQWEANTNTKYTVEFYYQDGDSYRLDHSDPRTDTTGSVTNADKEAKENGKYVYDTTAANVESGKVAADGSLVLKLYFKLNQADVTVNYYWNETTDKVATSKKLSAQTVGSVITTETPITIEGYTALPNQTSNLTVGADASKNVINFYYYKNVELTANSKTETYDGTEKSVSGYTGAPADADFSAITVGAKGTEVGTYPANFTEGTKGTVDANKKYIVTKANNGQLTITADATAIVVKIKGNTLTKTYDGNEYTVEGYDVVSISDTRYTATDFSFTGTAEAKGTNVKTDGYSMGLTAAQFTNTSENFSNVKFEVTDGKLTINPRKVTLTSESGEKEYDGTPLTNKTVSVTGDGFVTGEGATYDVTGTITNVADNKPNNNTFTYTLNKGTTAGNYVIEIMYGTLKITPVAAEVTVKIKGHTTDAIYDATEKTAEGYDVISISNELYTANDFALTGKDKVTGTAAGQYDMNLAFKNISENFSKVTFVVEDGKLTIAKRDVTVTGESATKVYNGQTQEINGYTVDNLVEGHEMTGVTYSAKGKDPGKYDGSFTGSQIVIKGAAGTDVTANYNVKPVIGVLTITQPSHPTRPSTPTKDVTSVKTADGSQMTLWMSMMLASAAGIVFLGKKRKEEQ